MKRLMLLTLLCGCTIQADTHRVARDTSEALDATTSLLESAKVSVGRLDDHVSAVASTVATVASSTQATLQKAGRAETALTYLFWTLAGYVAAALVHNIYKWAKAKRGNR